MQIAARLRWGWIVLLGVTIARSTSAAGTIYLNDFDTQAPTWRVSNPASNGQILRQARLSNPVSTEGATVERLVVVCPAGGSLVLTQRIDPTAVIEETLVALRIASNRPGVTIAAQAVLPRNVPPDGGQSPTLVVRGESYQPQGGWQELEIRGLPQLVTRQARVLRTTAGPQIDEREAYIDQVVLIVPGGPGHTEVVIDRLVVEGVAAQNAAVAGSTQPIEGPVFPSAELPATEAASTVTVRAVRVAGTQLTIDGRGFFPRIVQHNGEELELLARCGFNGVWLRESPSNTELAAARKLGLGLIAPPPREPIPADEASAWNPILAWDLGERLGLTQLDVVTAQARSVRRQDIVLQRPLIAAPSDSHAQFSHAADILLVGRRANLHDSNYSIWQRRTAQTMQSARPGTPLWVRIDLDHSPEVAQQLRVLAPHSAAVWQTPGRLAHQVHAALNTRACGFVFAAQQPLAASDSANSATLAACELLNRELRLIEPWLVSGVTPGAVNCTDPSRQAVVMQRDRVRLVALRRLPGVPSVAEPQLTPSPFSVTVPGVSESAGAYVLTPGGMRRLVQSRVSGGIRVSLAEVPPGAYLILTDDGAAVTALMRGASQGSKRAAQLARLLAVEELRQTEEIAGQLKQLPAEQSLAQRQVAAAKAAIGEADLALASGNQEEAYRFLLIARDQLATLVDQLLARPASSPELASNPLAGSLPLLLERWKLNWALDSLPPGGNLLYGGDCEELQQMQSYGWTHTSYPRHGIETTVELTTDQPQQGSRALRMAATTASESPPATIAETAAVWIASPEVKLAAGQTIEIAGWVWVFSRQSCRLTITDSLGGEELALDVDQTPDWQPFRMIRTTAEATTVQVKFALFGSGEARVDGVMIRPVLASRAEPPRRLPVVPVRNSP